MRYEQNGTSLWYDTPDAPAPGGLVPAAPGGRAIGLTLTVGVQPIAARNTVEVRYRVNNGAWLRAQTSLARTDIRANSQYFVAAFPEFHIGDVVEYSAVSSSARQPTSPDQANQFTASFRVIGAQSQPVAQPAVPSLRPASIMAHMGGRIGPTPPPVLAPAVAPTTLASASAPRALTPITASAPSGSGQATATSQLSPPALTAVNSGELGQTSFRRAENFVSYRIPFTPLHVLEEQEATARAGLGSSTDPSQRDNYRTHLLLLSIRREMQESDGAFDARRYQDALTGYRTVSQLILSLLDPQVLSRPAPVTWPNQREIAGPLLEASAGLLHSMLPEGEPVRLVALTRPVHISPAATGVSAFPTLQMSPAPAGLAPANLPPLRQLNVSRSEGLKTITWDHRAPPPAQALIDNIYLPRVAVKDPASLAFRSGNVSELAAQVPHLYHFLLPVKLGDCYHQLQEFQSAENEYRRAAAFEYVNLELEAPDLWRRVAENALAWGDSFYREGDSNPALPIYGDVLANDGTAPGSFLYAGPIFQATGLKVKAWLTALSANKTLPDLNPAIAAILQQLRKRWQYLNAGLDFFGQTDAGVPPFTFVFLQNTARYFANSAILSEQRFIEFMDRYQSAEMTRLDLQHASDLAAKEVEAAAARQAEAQAVADSAQHGVDLAQTRLQDATNTLNLFNSTAWESEELAGFIARGSAFTGSDQPNLNYQIGDTSYSGPKHQVLQQLTKRQTEIGIELQRDHLQSAVDDLQKAGQVAADQKRAADAHLQGAQIDNQIAALNQQHATEMLQSFDSQFFTPDQWWAMAMFMRGLTSTALTRAIDIAKLMQRAYNFENLDSRRIIRNSYDFGMKGLLGGEMLLADIDSFTHYRVTTVRHKPMPVKWPISLAESYPGQFELQFKRTGRMQFETDFSELTLLFPGTYRHQIAQVQVEFEGFIPPDGLHGRLKTSGITRYRDRNGQINLRAQPAETLALSPFSLARDAVLITPDPEIRPLFAGSSVASGWTLEVPTSANDVDLSNIFDARLVLFFECLFDEDLFVKDSQPPPATTFTRTRGLHLRFGFPDAYFALRQKGSATITLDARDFPFNQRQPTISAIALAAVPVRGASLNGVGVSFTQPGTVSAVRLIFDNNNTIARKNIPITGTPSAFGDYRFEFEGDSAKDKLADLILIVDYKFQPAV